jgi:hypothetical protein
LFYDRVSEKSKGKKVQKSLMSMMEKKKDENDDDEISDVELGETSARYRTKFETRLWP